MPLKVCSRAPFPEYVIPPQACGFALRAARLLGWFVAITATGSNAWAASGTTPTAGTVDAGTTDAGTTDSGTTTAPVVSGGVSSGTQMPTWREAKVTLTIDPTFAALPNARAALEAALYAYTSVASELPVVEVVDSPALGLSLSADVNVKDHRISFAVDGDPRAKGALAITLVSVNSDSSQIIDGDIIVNGEHHFTDVTQYPQSWHRNSPSYYDLQDVLTHELGHWFGLGENYVDTESTMYAYVDPGETKKRDLTVDDATAVQLAYWRADNPSENTGCALQGRPVRLSFSNALAGLGLLAVALLWLRRPNRLGVPHLPGQAGRLVSKGDSNQSR